VVALRIVDLRGERELSVEEVVSKTESAVTRISGRNIMGGVTTGSGFVVADGLVATNAHVIADVPEEEIRVAFPSIGGSTSPPLLATVVYYDTERDIALLNVQASTVPLVIAPSERFRRGRAVVIIGSPGVAAAITLPNAISTGVLSTETMVGRLKFWQLGGSINPGNSGGPVLDLQGRVLGIATGKARAEEAIAFCIPGSDLQSAIETSCRYGEKEITDARYSHSLTSSLEMVYMTASPARKLAMFSVGRYVTDDDPIARAFAIELTRAHAFYSENDEQIAAKCIDATGMLEQAGVKTSPGEILADVIQVLAWYRQPSRKQFSQVADMYTAIRLMPNVKRDDATNYVHRTLLAADYPPMQPPAQPPAPRELVQDQPPVTPPESREESSSSQFSFDKSTKEETPRQRPFVQPPPAMTQGTLGSHKSFGPVLSGMTTQKIQGFKMHGSQSVYGESPIPVAIATGTQVALRKIIGGRHGDDWLISSQYGSVVLSDSDARMSVRFVDK
jgi:hypothetical protein